MTDSDEVKLLPTVDEILRDYESGEMDAAGTIEDLVAIIDATRPPVVTDEVVELRGVLKKCRAQFEFYVQAHLAKQPPDMDRAATNQEFVELIDAAMPAVVSGGQSTGDHALPPSGLSQSSLSQSETAAAIARGEVK